jgi:LPPG:FO 2-phospho-L-lactate transferase
VKFDNIVALAGGVGGARLAQGLAQILPVEKLTVIVNTGDDFIFNGLNISPDIDTVCYTLAGMECKLNGWGIEGDSHQVLEQIRIMGGEAWFSIGDRDIALHLFRTQAIRQGASLSEITLQICQRLGIKTRILPMTDQPVHTKVRIRSGEWLDFQEYFVHRLCEPEVLGFKFEGLEEASPAPGVMEVLQAADLVIICPSNPWVSIDPILGIHQIRAVLEKKMVLAISPLIGGKAVKGPLMKMFTELGVKPSCLAIAEHYRDFLDGLIIDTIDRAEAGTIEAFGIITGIADILMKDAGDRKRLAEEILEFGKNLKHSL